MNRVYTSRRRFLRWSAAVTGALVAAPLLEACETPPGATTSGQPAATGSAAPTPRKGGHLTEAFTTDVKTFNPVLTQEGASITVSKLMFEGLLGGNQSPALAASFTVSTDGLTYTFKLRPDVKWSDGQPLTSDDVLFTYSLMFDPKYEKVSSLYRGNLTTYVDSITAPDATTFVIKLKKTYAPFLLAHVGYGIVPKHILGAMSAEEINAADFNTNPTVVNGVFKFVKWEKGQQVTLERNPNYYRGPSNLDNYIFRVVPNNNAIAAQLKTGEVDFAYVDATQVANVQGVDTLVLVGTPANHFEVYTYQMDPAKPGGVLFGDKSVRQALVYALDRQKIADVAWLKGATVARSIELPTAFAYDPSVKQYAYDKAKAESLLDSAGWKKVSGSEVRAKDGKPFKFTVLAPSGSTIRQSELQIMQQMWKDVGADVEIQQMEFSALLTRVIQQKDFDIVCLDYGNPAYPDADLSFFFHSRNAKPGAPNLGSYINPEADNALDTGLTTVDTTKRKEIYKRFQEIFAEDVPTVPLVVPTDTFAVNKRLVGVDVASPTGRTWMKDAWASDGK
jgi:peptide/nickel transport system substrate-binding protein